jgi:exopolysaccharide biosynthesis polyprenyl glycosylphosphotransferase
VVTNSGERAAEAAHHGSRDWRSRYARRLMITDFLVLAWVIFGVQIAWFGVDAASVTGGEIGELAVNYTTISVVLLLGWMAVLGIYGTRGQRVIGTGSQEYRLIADGALRLFGLVAIVAFLGQIEFARGYILIALPMGTVVLIFARWMWRQWLGVQRIRGTYTSRVVLVGSRSSVVHIARELDRQPGAGYLVVGVCVPLGEAGELRHSVQVPIYEDLDRVQEAMHASGADTVVITSADELPPEKVRRLSWDLEPGRQHLVVAPSLIDIGGPRVHTRPVAGLPLIHVETPRYEGSKRFVKRTFDILSSGFGIAVLSPILLTIAVIVRLSSAGPVLFRQERIGLNGERFEMLKFRSMVIDAEARLQRLQAEQQDSGNIVMFKMRDDPRITPVGRFLRRYSLDELPQLLNVFTGSMSLVGPRPPLAREVQQYESHVHRRFLVKPGITGLWQVSGRSNLSWDESVRLDLYYVENWSLTNDLVILFRTAKAVLVKDGAY